MNLIKFHWFIPCKILVTRKILRSQVLRESCRIFVFLFRMYYFCSFSCVILPLSALFFLQINLKFARSFKIIGAFLIEIIGVKFSKWKQINFENLHFSWFSASSACFSRQHCYYVNNHSILINAKNCQTSFNWNLLHYVAAFFWRMIFQLFVLLFLSSFIYQMFYSSFYCVLVEVEKVSLICPSRHFIDKNSQTFSCFSLLVHISSIICTIVISVKTEIYSYLTKSVALFYRIYRAKFFKLETNELQKCTLFYFLQVVNVSVENVPLD